jgi:dihydroxy-acid dehydratase
VKQRFDSQGFIVRAGVPAHYTKFVEAERERWVEVIKARGSSENDEEENTRTCARALVRTGRTFAPSARSRALQMGYDHADCRAKPSSRSSTWSDINQCHAHFKERVRGVKRGVLQAAASRSSCRASRWRAIRQADDDAVPQPARDRDRGAAAQPSGRRRGADGRLRQDHARAADGRDQHGLPCIYLPAGPMLRGNWKGKRARLGLRRVEVLGRAPRRATSRSRVEEIEGGIARSAGTCMVMGTAATMMGIAEALGMTLPGASSIPAVDANHQRMARDAAAASSTWCGKTSRPRRSSRAELRERDHGRDGEGCSTNAIIHLVAMSRRAGGMRVSLDDFDAFSPQGAGHRQHPAQRRQVPDGGLLLRRRHARPDERLPTAACCTSTR